MEPNITRWLAFNQLLALPDPPGMRRSHIVRLEGKPDRHNQLPELAAAFVREKLIEIRQKTLRPAVPVPLAH